MQYSFAFGRELLSQCGSGVVFQPARTVLSSITVRVPSIPARTSAGRQTRERNSVRRSGLPHRIGKDRRFGRNGYRSRCSWMMGTSQPGSGTVRRPVLLLGYSLTEVCPLTPTTVRTTERRERSRLSASRRRPAASPQRRPAPEGFSEGQTHRPPRRSDHHRGHHAEPGVVIDAGDDLAFGAISQYHPADDVDLP
jgi:hypothetical protein